MAKICLMFPGQGSQSVGMGKVLYEKEPRAREIIDQAGDELKKIIFEGPEETLKLTKYTQPAIFTVSIAAFEVLKENIDFSKHDLTAAGHSLGEYSALCAAGFCSFKESLDLVRARGSFIQETSEKNPGAMAAVLGLEKQVLDDICKEASALGVCEPVNFNSPGQIVIAGQIEALNKALEIAKTKGALKSVMLNVSGPFHSSLMKEASDNMSKELEKYNFKEPSFGIWTNCDATLTKDPSKLKEKLVRQINNAVKWDESISNIVKEGFTHFIEVGPGKVLSGLLRRIDKSKKAINFDDGSNIETIKTEFGA